MKFILFSHRSFDSSSLKIQNIHVQVDKNLVYSNFKLNSLITSLTDFNFTFSMLGNIIKLHDPAIHLARVSACRFFAGEEGNDLNDLFLSLWILFTIASLRICSPIHSQKRSPLSLNKQASAFSEQGTKLTQNTS